MFAQKFLHSNVSSNLQYEIDMPNHTRAKVKAGQKANNTKLQTYIYLFVQVDTRSKGMAAVCFSVFCLKEKVFSQNKLKRYGEQELKLTESRLVVYTCIFKWVFYILGRLIVL